MVRGFWEEGGGFGGFGFVGVWFGSVGRFCMGCGCEVMGGSCVGLSGVGGRAGRRGLSGIDGRGRGRVGIGVCGVLAGSGAGIEAEGGGGAVLGWALFAVVVSSWHGLAAIGRIGVGGVDPGGGGVAC